MTDLRKIAEWHEALVRSEADIDALASVMPNTARDMRESSAMHSDIARAIRQAIEDAECGALVREHLASHAPSGITFAKHQLDGLDWTYAISGGHAFSIREANALPIAVASARKATT